MNDEQIIRVRDVMKSNFDQVDGMTTVTEAINYMKHKENKSLIVKKRHPDDEYGILLISDIARRVLGEGRSPDRVNVYEVMAKPVITVHPDMDIRYCAQLFERFELSRAPVVQQGEVVGIVSLTDLVLKGLCKTM
ncbi:MAG: CBS domain-containing protein [Gammaproteobacteria bacterium]|jgi:CBS domain-containing protein|nr:CBS domain-containing protein [Gammaproteobacteria bacterium]